MLFRTRSQLVLTVLVIAGCLPGVASGQFDQIPVPEAMHRLDFMVGEWVVEGAFRTPDHVGSDRTLWYLTRNGGVTRFDGQTWTAFAAGESGAADAVLAAASTLAEPFVFENHRTVVAIQDGFALLVDEGRTSGSTVIHFDTAAEAWVANGLHAPTNAMTRSQAPLAERPVFEGRAVDRRGERIFRTRYEIHGPDHYTVRTDVSFDEGSTWIDDQIVLQVRRS